MGALDRTLPRATYSLTFKFFNLFVEKYAYPYHLKLPYTSPVIMNLSCYPTASGKVKKWRGIPTGPSQLDTNTPRKEIVLPERGSTPDSLRTARATKGGRWGGGVYI